jgi:hypothetical protein
VILGFILGAFFTKRLVTLISVVFIKVKTLLTPSLILKYLQTKLKTYETSFNQFLFKVIVATLMVQDDSCV